MSMCLVIYVRILCKNFFKECFKLLSGCSNTGTQCYSFRVGINNKTLAAKSVAEYAVSRLFTDPVYREKAFANGCRR